MKMELRAVTLTYLGFSDIWIIVQVAFKLLASRVQNPYLKSPKFEIEGGIPGCSHWQSIYIDMDTKISVQDIARMFSLSTRTALLEWSRQSISTLFWTKYEVNYKWNIICPKYEINKALLVFELL